MTTSVAEISAITDSSWGGFDDDEAMDDLQTPIIYGRERETELLRGAFEQVCQTKRASTVVVHGCSGMGKTSLVDTLRVPVIESRGYFCAGKFFQNAAFQEPLSAIMAAFSDVCDIVLQSEDFNEERRSEIQEALGTSGHLLTNTISNITPFLGDGAGEKGLGDSSFSDFKVACKTFIQAVSSDDHPLVVFIDDIQWMDVESKQLIELLLGDKDLKNVLLILAYRDEEAESAEQIIRDDHEVVDMQLAFLDASAVEEIVCATFVGGNSDRMKGLSQLVLERTMGSPYHIRSFIEMLRDEYLISFDADSKAWVFEVDVIRTSTMILSSLADLLSRKIELVDPGLKETLVVASLMGWQFSETVLLDAMSLLHAKPIPPSGSESQIQVAAISLSQAIKIGFIEKIKDGFQFSHDKIQTAFRELVLDDSEETERIHRVIGETILDLQPGDGIATIYHGAVHLHSARSTITSEKERRRLVEITMEAAKYCMGKVAYVAASDLLRQGLTVMDTSERWSDPHFDLTFEMTELFAKTEIIIGNFASAQEATNEAILRAKSTEMKLESLLRDTELRMATDEIDKFITCCKPALQGLGVSLPKRVSRRCVLAKCSKVNKKMGKLTDQEILGLPANDERLTSTAIKLLATLTSCLMQDDRNLAFYAASTAMELTLDHGLSTNSPTAFSNYLVVLIATGNHTDAYRLGKLALGLIENGKCNANVSLTVAQTVTEVSWRKEPFPALRDQLQAASLAGIQEGKVIGGIYCNILAIVFDTIIGKSLHDVEVSLRKTWNQAAELGQDAMLEWVKPTLQYVRNLQSNPGNWREVLMLSGDVMNEAQFLVEAKKGKHVTLIGIALAYKCFLACAFRYFPEASDCCEQLEQTGQHRSYGQLNWLFCVSYSNFELYRVSKRRKHWRKACRSKTELEKLVKEGCSDAEPFLAFVCAVEASLKRNIDNEKLSTAFDEALSLANSKENYRLEGLLSEQAGFDFARRGGLPRARSYFQRALDVYCNSWCSNAKYDWLVERAVEYSPEAEVESTMAPSQVGQVIMCNSSSDEEY